MGVVGVYLPETKQATPPASFDINRLIVGSSAPYLFRMQVNTTHNGNKKLRQSTVKQQDTRFGTTGVRLMERVENQLEQNIYREMHGGDTLQYESGRGFDMPTFRWEGTDLVMDKSKVKRYPDGVDYRFSVDTLLAQRMQWLVPNADRSYSLGHRL